MSDEVIILILILIIAIAVIATLSLKKRQVEKTRQLVLEDLKSSISEDNQLTKELYASNEFLRENFKEDILSNRLILYGFVNDELFIVKHKQKELRVGFPNTFKTTDKYFDVCMDLSEFNTNNHSLPENLGAENNCWYIKVDLNTERIENSILELSSVRKIYTGKVKGISSTAIDSFEEYKDIVNKSGYEYL